MTEDEESIENTLKSVKDMIKSSRKNSDLDDGVLELTEDDLFDDQDEDYQDIDDNKKTLKNPTPINQLLTPIGNNGNISLEQAIAESIKPLLKDWLDQAITSIVKRELEKQDK